MSELQSLSIEELEKEIQRRKLAAVSDIRRQIEEKKAEIRKLEAQIREAEGAPAASTRKPRAANSNKLPAGERAERVLTALDGLADGIAPSEIAAKVGFDGLPLRATLGELLAEGKLVRLGKARGTKYRLA